MAILSAGDDQCEAMLRTLVEHYDGVAKERGQPDAHLLDDAARSDVIGSTLHIIAKIGVAAAINVYGENLVSVAVTDVIRTLGCLKERYRLANAIADAKIENDD